MARIAVIGQFRLPPDAMPAARPMMAQVMEATRSEAGCIEYSYAEDVLDPGLIRVSEVWDSRERLAAHLKTPHMTLWAEQRAALGLSGRALTMYEVAREETF